MTETVAPSPEAATVQTDPSADLVPIIKASLAKVDSGKASMGDLFAAVLTDTAAEPVTVLAVPAPTSISDEHRVMLTRLPEVFGRVNPDVVRTLTTEELVTLAEERDVISGLLSLLKERKEEGIREIVALHFDKVAEADGKAEDAPRDPKGHYLLKQAQPVGDTGKKFTRELRENKPSLDGESLLAAYERGDITREEYLSCTRETRVYDETKTRAALKKNPLLLVKLRSALRKGGLTASIYLR